MAKRNVKPAERAGNAPSDQWSPARRTVVSGLIVAHLFCVVIAASVVPPTSELLVSIHRVIRPYLQFMYLNHGYRFFAPEPGPSHIVVYELENGESGQFPDREQIRPRLRYHRWFMLSETVYSDVSQYMTDAQIASWTTESQQIIAQLRDARLSRQAAQLDRDFAVRRRQQLELNRMTEELSRSISQVLSQQQGGGGIRLYSVTREIPAPQDLLSGRKLTDPIYLPSDGRVDMQTFERGQVDTSLMEPIR